MDNLILYLAEIKSELQELYEDLNNELQQTENQALIDDSYNNITSKLETALVEIEILITDINNGIYDNNDMYMLDDE
jgi:ElaB/YqjD/DUF883 family membrane-anchored ribosome-binding protein